MEKIKALIILFFVLPHAICAQEAVIDTLNINDFEARGGSEAEWMLHGDTTVSQEWENHPPSFYVYPFDQIDAEFSCRIRIDSERDFDYVGLVFGYQSPESINDSLYRTYLFNWKGKTGYFHGYYGYQGYAISQIKAQLSEEKCWRYFYGNTAAEDTLKILHTKYFSSARWRPHRDYILKIRYLKDSLAIFIGEKEVFSTAGCFDAGLFGFYTFSQPHAQFSYPNIKHEAIIRTNQTTSCVGDEIVYSVNPMGCTVENPFFTKYTWIINKKDTLYGEGGSLIPEEAGSLNIKLIAQSINNRIYEDSTVINILKKPIVNLGRDTAFTEGDSMILKAPTGNFTYLWSNGSTDSSVTVFHPGYYWVSVDNGGCIISDTIHIFMDKICNDTLLSYNFMPAGSADDQWKLTGNFKIEQTTASAYPAFFLYPEKMIDADYICTLAAMNPDSMNFMGLVFGLQAPLATSDSTFDFYLFDWKGNTSSLNSYTGKGGYTLSRVKGKFSHEEIRKYFFGHNECPGKFNILKSKHDPEAFWQKNQKYKIRIRYHHNIIQFFIDDNIIFEEKGCYQPAYFGLYSFYQDKILFENPIAENNISIYLNNTKICLGDTLSFSTQDPNCPVTNPWITDYEWFMDEQTDTVFGSSGKIQINEVGNHSIKLQIKTKNLCQILSNRSFQGIKIPDIDLGPDTSIYATDTLILYAGPKNYNYTWSNGSKKRELEIIDKGGAYWLRANNYGCTSYDTIQVSIINVGNFGLPNAFTPNNDGINDELALLGKLQHLASFSLQVFDQSGTILYASTDPYDSWDGKYDGKTVESGVYFFQLQYLTKDLQSFSRKGKLRVLP